MGLTVAGIVAIVGAIAGVTSGLVGTIQQGQEAYSKAESEQKYIDELYKKRKEQAEIEYNKAKEEAEKNAKKLDLQADLTDKTQDVAETSLSSDFNTAIDNLYLNQAGDAWNWNNAAMQVGSSTGAAYANLASSGVRAGGSMSDAILMESSLNSAQLQFSQDAKRRQDTNNLGSVLNQLAGNRYGIMRNRIGADLNREDANWLRDSWLEGGYNYNLYENQQGQLKVTHDYQYEVLQKEKDKWWKDGGISWDAFWTGATNMLSLGAKGAQTGYNLYDVGYKSVGYTTSLHGASSGKSSE